MTRSARRGPWLPEEDGALLQLVQTQGANNWVRISQQLQHRSPKQCRERFHQNLKPSLKHEPISIQEGERIEQMVAEMGKRWAEIARRLGNRSDNAVKNWWNGSMNRRRRNPTHTMTGFKHAGTRLQPMHFAPDQSQPYSGQHALSVYEHGSGSSVRSQWIHHPPLSQAPPSATQQPPSLSRMSSHTTDGRPPQISIHQLASPIHTNDSSTTSNSPVCADQLRLGQHRLSNSSIRSPAEHTGSASTNPGQLAHRPNLPPLQSASSGSQLNKRELIHEQPLVSPALSEASQSMFTHHAPPSLVSDNQSTLSISPRTVASPRPNVLVPADVVSVNSVTWQQQKYNSHQHHSQTYQPATHQSAYSSQQRSQYSQKYPAMHTADLHNGHTPLPHVSKIRDSRMHLSSLLG